MTDDEKYMARALQLARLGSGFAHPNPMVGAVIVENGEIIGEGFHALCGEGHAEVNAVKSVKDKDMHRLKNATIYVTLEPCSHYGKTPPCSKLLIEKEIKRVVVGMEDPFPKVAGGGIKMLREAGIDVEVGVLEQECRRLNKRFITAHTSKRPYIQLKWAQTNDGFIASENGKILLSTPLTQVLMHKERSKADAILVGTNTIIIDNPALTCRKYPGKDPLKITFNHNGRLPKDNRLNTNSLIVTEDVSLSELCRKLYEECGITSLMVEGGAAVLNSFIREGLYDELRIEQSPMKIGKGIKAPQLPAQLKKMEEKRFGPNLISAYSNVK